MFAITVDDERPMLTALTAAVSASPDISAVTEFRNCTSVLDWLEDNSVDIAFLDISMRGMGGLALAEKITKLHPNCRIVFCTSYTQYALDAIQLRCSGYLIKPITAEAVQKEIDHIKGRKAQEKLLTVKCFGNFEVFSHGELVPFKRTKSKELLAVLIDRNGSSVTSKQICAIMWSDDTDDAKNMAYLRQLFSDLRNTLEQIGANKLLKHNVHSYALDTERIDCDYFEFLRTGKPEFHGEYMTQYSWAEERCAILTQKRL